MREDTHIARREARNAALKARLMALPMDRLCVLEAKAVSEVFTLKLEPRGGSRFQPETALATAKLIFDVIKKRRAAAQAEAPTPIETAA